MIKKYVYGEPFETEALTEKIETAEGRPGYGEICTDNGFSFTYIMDEEDIVYARKHQCGDRPVVGVNIGSTINMENYESLRADVWLSDIVQPNESIEQAYERVTNIVAKTLEHIVETYQ